MVPFDWKKDDQDYVSNVEDFSDPNVGWTPMANNCKSSELDCFLKIFSPEAMEFCIFETNQYARTNKR